MPMNLPRLLEAAAGLGPILGNSNTYAEAKPRIEKLRSALPDGYVWTRSGTDYLQGCAKALGLETFDAKLLLMVQWWQTANSTKDYPHTHQLADFFAEVRAASETAHSKERDDAFFLKLPQWPAWLNVPDFTAQAASTPERPRTMIFEGHFVGETSWTRFTVDLDNLPIEGAAGSYQDERHTYLTSVMVTVSSHQPEGRQAKLRMLFDTTAGMLTLYTYPRDPSAYNRYVRVEDLRTDVLQKLRPLLSSTGIYFYVDNPLRSRGLISNKEATDLVNALEPEPNRLAQELPQDFLNLVKRVLVDPNGAPPNNGG